MNENIQELIQSQAKKSKIGDACFITKFRRRAKSRAFSNGRKPTEFQR